MGTFDRKKLYEEVWEDPMSKVAPRYAMSDTGLRKVCKRLKVPIPSGAGYWQKVRAGEKIKRPPLPKYNGSSISYTGNLESYQRQQNKREKPKQKLDVKIEQYSMKVSDQLINPHPLVVQLCKRMEKEWPERYACQTNIPLSYFLEDVLNVRVSKGTVYRALCIMDVVIKTLNAKGYTVYAERQCTYVKINGENVYFHLRECLKPILHQKITEEDSSPERDFLPTGKLKFVLGDSPLKVELDVPGKSLEDRLNVFINKLMFTAARSKRQKEEHLEKHLEEERRYQEANERRKIQKELYAKETKKIKELEERALDWQLAQTIKNYVNACESSLDISLSANDLTKQLEYIAWARKKIDWLNPLVNKKDDILGCRRTKD